MVSDLVVFRHTEYDENTGLLTPRGVEQLSTVSAKIKEVLAGHDRRKIKVVAMPKLRAVQSAVMVASALGVKEVRTMGQFMTYSELSQLLVSPWPESDDYEARRYEVPWTAAVLSGHAEEAEDFPAVFGREVLRVSFRRYRDLPFGSVVAISLTQRYSTLLP